MKILVTGASGFVGRAVSRALLAAGHDVHALTRSPARLSLSGPLQARPFEGSIGDPVAVAEAASGCDVVIHAAGLAHPRCPERVARWVHVAGTENVLNAARHAGVRRVVHISCADVTLHDGDRLHWDELRALPRLPEGPHARTKLMAEELALAKSDPELEVTALRPAWLWGPGDFDGALYLNVLSAGRGIPMPGGGRNLLATTHIDNLCTAVLAATEAPAAPGRAYHVTDGDFSEAREFLGQLSQALELPAPRPIAPLPWALWRARLGARLGSSGPTPAEILRLGRGALFDLSKATKDLDYTPHGQTDASMRQLAEWVREAGGLAGVLAKARPLPQANDVDAQVALAGGD